MILEFYVHRNLKDEAKKKDTRWEIIIKKLIIYFN